MTNVALLTLVSLIRCVVLLSAWILVIINIVFSSLFLFCIFIIAYIFAFVNRFLKIFFIWCRWWDSNPHELTLAPKASASAIPPHRHLLIKFGADSGTWTHTPSLTTDFESVVSAIPPYPHAASFLATSYQISIHSPRAGWDIKMYINKAMARALSMSINLKAFNVQVLPLLVVHE